MLDALKNLRPWQTAILAVVIIGIAGGGFAIYNWATGSDTVAIPDDIQLVQVQYGSLENSVSASGSLLFPYREELTFDSAGTIQEVNVEEGDAVLEGQVLTKLDDASVLLLQQAVVQSRINLENALDSLETAQENLEEARNPYTESDIAQAELTVINAGLALETARENLDKAQNPYTEADIVRAELVVLNAEIALENAENAFERAEDRYEMNPTVPDWITDYKLKQKQLAIAEFDLAEAEDNLAIINAGADSVDIEQKQKHVIIAQTNLAQEEENLADMQDSTGPLELDSLQVELKQIEVASAQTSLDKAIERLEAATMVAPFDGIVVAVNVEAGQNVSASQNVMEIVDPSVVDLNAILDEIDISLVKQGQRATISLDALSDIELTGEVYSISTTARVQSGVVTYPMTIRLTVPDGLQLREGMSATASIIVEQADNVLLVPNQAISGSFDNPVVNVMVNEETRQRVVTLGISDGLWTEVIAGLDATDIVVVQITNTGTTQFDFGGGMMIPGMGGFGRMR
ncbi:MAG TPA: efflux RND transporter periplasmic adaptor subunit [Dehalococcoidales bacterium]|nr:efflux RND transporter periplasmic adaptor subunit [Dehalococcoidales bacterium]